MGYTVMIQIRPHDGSAPDPGALGVTGWLHDLNVVLSAKSGTFRFEIDGYDLLAWATPGDDVDLDRVIDACLELRSARPDLHVELTDSLDNELMPPPPGPVVDEGPSVELTWKDDVLEILLGPVDDDLRPDVLVDFGEGRTTQAPPLWKTRGRWFYQVWLLGELVGVRSATVRVVEG